MAAGKNKLQKHIRVYAGGVDVSGDGRTLGTLDNSFEAVDLTSWSNSVRYSMANKQRMTGARGFSGFMNDASGGWLERFQNPANARAFAVVFGGGGEPETGDPAYILPSLQHTAPIQVTGGAVILTTDFLPEAENIGNFDNPWGTLIFPKTSISATTNGTFIDNGAATTAGYFGVVFVFGTSSGSFSFIVQQSTTGAGAGEETTLFTFGVDGSSISSDFADGSGSVARYIRFRAVRTAGTVSCACCFARNY